MLISDVAKKYGVSVRTIRYYEELKMIKPGRNAANVRCFDSQNLKVLEEILLYKSLNISLSDIQIILKDPDQTQLKTLLYKELRTLDEKVFDWSYKRQLLRSLLSTYGTDDLSKQSVKAFVQEQLFFQQDEERWSHMLNTQEHITLEIGKDLIPLALTDTSDSLIDAIKELRQSIKTIYNLDLEKIRLKDNLKDLEPNEFRILINDETVILKRTLSDVHHTQIDQIITNIKALVI